MLRSTMSISTWFRTIKNKRHDYTVNFVESFPKSTGQATIIFLVSNAFGYNGHRQEYLNLIPVKTKFSALNRDVMPILGRVILRPSGKSESHNDLEISQVCCVNDVIEVPHLNWEACKALRIIRSDFPRIGSAFLKPMSVSSAVQAHLTRSAIVLAPYAPSRQHYQIIYQSRQLTPTGPIFPNWIPDRYQLNTFNTREGQTLRLIEGSPFELVLQAKPIAVHKLIPVPLYWQQEVKASIHRDVKRGVL